MSGDAAADHARMRNVSPELMQALRAFCEKWKVAELSLFGSILRDDFGPESDLDLLVSFVPDAGWSLYDIVYMIAELEAASGRKVDLVEKEALRNPFRKKAILESREIVHAA